MNLRPPLISRIPWYKLIVRPLLFRLPPESAQRAADLTLSVRPLWRAYAKIANISHRPTTIASINLRNQVGLAAGLDKRCAYLGSLGDFGFGYVVGGTVTRDPRPGNPKPRVLRLPSEASLLNALGFPGDGLNAAVAHLQKLQNRPAKVWVSIAALEELETQECFTTLEPLIDAAEINISSPNTAGLRRFQEPVALRGLLNTLNQVRNKPLFVKIPPYRTEAERESVMALVRVCRETGVTGITAGNTIPVDDTRLAMGRGGLSGSAILPDMLRIVPEIRSEVGAELIINACGGISTANDAQKALSSGANTVQIYTSMVYRGPRVVSDIVEGLARNDE